MGKTHAAVGIASAFLALQPKTPKEYIAAVIGGVIGGVAADVDVKVDRSSSFMARSTMDAFYGEMVAATVTACMVAVDAMKGAELIHEIQSNGAMAYAGAVLFCVLFLAGEWSRHRDRTHSVLALLLSSAAVLMIHVPIGIAFAVGYASHLAIDLLNKQPIRLFYPLKRKIGLKLCYADGFFNEFLFTLGMCIVASYILLSL